MIKQKIRIAALLVLPLAAFAVWQVATPTPSVAAQDTAGVATVQPAPAQPVASAAGCTTDADCALPDQMCVKAVGNCDGSGTCEIRPDVCIQVYDPVCGCDGVTYSNSCVALSNGVNVASEGECGGPVCGERNDPCSSDADCCSGVCKRNGKCR